VEFKGLCPSRDRISNCIKVEVELDLPYLLNA
jgi:hypothetical protein